MSLRRVLLVTWPAFLAACVLQAVVFAAVDPLEVQWLGRDLAWSRQAVYAVCFFVFWGATLLASALTALLVRGSD